MIRLHVVAEGQTEEEFVNSVLVPHLADRDIFVDVQCVVTGRKRARTYKGGLLKYAHLHNHLSNWMKQERKRPESWFTTMIDLYRLPSDWPDFEEAGKSPSAIARVQRLEVALANTLNHRQFRPYIQLHEFEALLLTAPDALLPSFPLATAGVAALRELVSDYASPEQIDDGAHTAPSKRIIAHIPEYDGQKLVAGPLTAQRIGLARLRDACPHFAQWISKLETLAVEP